MANKKILDHEQIAYFCEQLWLMVNSGMQLDNGLELMAEDVEDPYLRKLCMDLSNQLDKGDTLFAAMEASGAFPQYAVRMVEIGTVAGRLDDVLKALSEYYDNRAETERTVRYSVFHPAMLLVMMTVVMIVLVVKVIPMFADVFSQFDSEIGAAVINTVNIAYAAGQVILWLLLAIIAILLVIFLIPPVRKAVASFFSVFPLTRGISRSFAQAKLTDAMCMMITSGLDPEESLTYARTLITDKAVLQRLDNCISRVKKGEYFADAICSSGILPKTYSRSLKLAYTSGSFDAVWRKISRRSNEESQKTLSNLISFVEPAIVVLLALMIGSVLMTIMLPLMNIMSALG